MGFQEQINYLKLSVIILFIIVMGMVVCLANDSNRKQDEIRKQFQPVPTMQLEIIDDREFM